MRTSEPAGIQCPECGFAGQQMIVDTRQQNGYVWRRRKCLKCGKRFSTYEMGGKLLGKKLRATGNG